jgi:hypothetical protein
MASPLEQQQAIEALSASGSLDNTRKQPAAYKRNADMMNAFPLLVVPVVIYNFLAIIYGFSGGDSSAAYTSLTQPLFSIPMPSAGTIWHVSIGDVLLLGGMFCLFFELIKSTQSDQMAIINHSLSLVVFVVCLIEFLLLPPFATSTFFLLSMMALMDVVAGFIVTIISARKDIEFGGGAH